MGDVCSGGLLPVIYCLGTCFYVERNTKDDPPAPRKELQITCLMAEVVIILITLENSLFTILPKYKG